MNNLVRRLKRTKKMDAFVYGGVIIMLTSLTLWSGVADHSCTLKSAGRAITAHLDSRFKGWGRDYSCRYIYGGCESGYSFLTDVWTFNSVPIRSVLTARRTWKGWTISESKRVSSKEDNQIPHWEKVLNYLMNNEGKERFE